MVTCDVKIIQYSPIHIELELSTVKICLSWITNWEPQLITFQILVSLIRFRYFESIIISVHQINNRKFYS
jgi:hypothetical protein